MSNLNGEEEELSEKEKVVRRQFQEELARIKEEMREYERNPPVPRGDEPQIVITI
ncbi:hypothetical protein IH779_03720 [Patescibacteria group bacterium]|nr:hypothetical protein [Patescibacteria group bacterium]